jgi:FkbM family methyltransferase
MPFVSYAQNFEDVMLLRALSHVENGFYVDVGAYSADYDSVTKAFYERGWYGINVEPNPARIAEFTNTRPRDLNLAVAVSDLEGWIELYVLSNPGLTTLELDVAERHKNAGLTTSVIQVQRRTLSSILEEHVGPDQAIHFLKIDVEGHELAALRGLDLRTYRPWVLVIEATSPMSQETTHEQWDPLIVNSGYHFVYWDGLNRFYVADERQELASAFSSPPNVFDNFKMASEVLAREAETVAREAETVAREAETVAREAETVAREAETVAREAEGVAITALHDAELRQQAADANARTISNQLEHATFTVTLLNQKIEYLTNRSLWEKLLFRPTGKPKKVLRRLLFHKSGKPRGVFRNWVLCGDGTPRQAFRMWMESEAYLHLPRPHSVVQQSKRVSVLHGYLGGKGRRRVAIIAPVSPSGSSGGAERLYNGLARAMREQGFDADLITIPFDESSFEAIQAGYAKFEAMDLDEYDLVISTKAPSYCIRHRNHVLYLVHTIRVFYDMFEATFHNVDKSRTKQQAWIRARDTEAISRIDRRYAIGEEVAKRLRTYNDLDAEVLHPGLDIVDPIPSPVGDYLFLPGRLHRWKRVHLAIEAIRRSSLPIILRIAGTGEEEVALRDLAGDDTRIVFEGYVDDKRLAELYAGSLGVVFCPIKEDYGYVTIEAFAHGKPVITCTDSGEPLQFVSDGFTGFVADPNPDSVRNAIERLWSDRQAAQRMGTAAAEVARTITWDRVARQLARRPSSLAYRLFKDRGHDRLRVAVVDIQPITPAVGGGRLRLLGLYHDLGDDFETLYVGAYDWRGEPYRMAQITPSLKEVVLPLSDEHYSTAEKARTKAGGNVVIDTLFGTHAHLSPDYIEKVNSSIAWADIVVFSHPWVAPLVSDDALAGKLVVYDSHNMEYDLRSRLLDPNDEFQASVIGQVESAEKLVGSRADLILTCSPEDGERFTEHYGWLPQSMEVVPNGAFVNDFSEIDATSKAEARGRVGLDVQTMAAFFIGSNYGPNAEAADEIVRRIAPACPEVTFVIAGDVCASLARKLPGNVRAIGQVSDRERIDWLSGSDIALNPMLSGSGTNIKMFEYAAASLPIVTTPIGARGILQTSSHGITVCEIEEMSAVVNSLAKDIALRIDHGAKSRRLVKSRFAWERLSRDLGRLLVTELLQFLGRKNKEQVIANVVRIVHFSTVGQKCGIGEYTRHLMHAMDEVGFNSMVFTCDMPNSPPDLSGMENRSAVAWFNDNVKHRDTALHDDIDAMVAASDAQYAIIQHHPGFLSPDDLRRLVMTFEAHGVRVVVVTHSFLNEQTGLIAELTSMGVPVLSHKKQDVIQAAANGVTLLHVPLAIPARDGADDRTSSCDVASPVIISNGFLRQHKGFVRLVEAFALVREVIPGASLRLLCSLYPSADSERAKQDVERSISRLGLETSVDFDTAYHDKEQLLTLLAQADLAVFPYDESAEGGSAAVADAIAVGLPIVVSPSSIFDDVRNVALTCGTDPRQLADGILDVLTADDRYLRMARATRAYAERNSWKRVIETFTGLLTTDILPNSESGMQTPVVWPVKLRPDTQTSLLSDKWFGGGSVIDYEELLEEFYRKLDLRDQLVVDIGGHLGRHAFPLAEMVGTARGTVFAFEPLPDIRNRFLTEIAERGVTNIVVFPFALSNVDGLADFCFIPNNPGESGLKERRVYNDAPSEIVQITVGVRRLDDLVPERRKVAFLKIDAEGAEWDILKGSREMIKDSRPIVAFECGAASFLSYHDSPEDIFDLFANLNYLVFSITGVKVDEREKFRKLSHEQKFWDYIALPEEKSHLSTILTARSSF